MYRFQQDFIVDNGYLRSICFQNFTLNITTKHVRIILQKVATYLLIGVFASQSNYSYPRMNASNFFDDMSGANDPYEREQRRLQQLFDELSSDDEEIDPFHDSDGSSDPDYEPNESSDTDAEEAGPSRYQEQELLFNHTSSEEDNDEESIHLSDPERQSDDGDESESSWETTTAPIPVFDFDENSVGVKVNIDETSTPLEVFEFLFTPQILEYIVQCSNDYGELLSKTNRPKTRHSRSANYRAITIDEMKAFLGLCLLQGQVSTTNVRRFFSYKDILYYHPIFPFVMSARRFEHILRVLCCSAPKSKGKAKIQMLLDMLIDQYQKAYGPTRELSLDESLLHFRGRLGFRVYIKNKKDRYGIKFYELTTSDGYVLNMEMYSGHSSDHTNDNGKTEKGNDSHFTLTEKLVLRLMKPYLLKGHELFMDNYYNSVSLSEKLLRLKTHTNGTLRSNRRGNPKALVKKKLKRGEHFWMRKKQVYVAKWKDKRDLLVITTRNHPRMITVRNRYGKEKNKPEEVATYNEHMSDFVEDRLL
ncbi:unnamed protein product [Acanthoscelides obtectus]|uniref:PiggyBac transposable element-derived protein domain-containing protein n=1 Tax=Acanthoscelides obtectus TaxID=200917 RepID=A0A9P0LVX6_ACAOB|nr:unnamed protein product [Acanthoscelides obtectus]CAK1649420.1 PiggyBac transposable element-derived protein 4 [Acanthoscelides obtectus]